jgi:hypothetical protein
MIYEDILEMMTAILGYVKEYPGRVIVSDDVPDDMLIGFTLKDIDPFLLNRPTWRINLKNFRSSVAKLSERPREIMTEYFQTAFGRESMARLLTRGLRPSEVDPKG